MLIEPAIRTEDGKPAGALIVNADDWGRTSETTDRTLECVHRRSVSSVSAMVFMKDSERAAALAGQHGVDAGLHVNLTTGFSAQHTPARLKESQRKLAEFLARNSFTRAIFNPLLARSFEYVFEAQRDEFTRLYGSAPDRFDGHHHMHLCANVLCQGLLPRGTIIRRHFSYEPQEKMLRHGIFRLLTDMALTRRHRMTDHFFSLPPLEPFGRLKRIFTLACHSVVELETHPVNPEEYRYLAGGEMLRCVGDCRIADHYAAKQICNVDPRKLDRMIEPHI